MARRSACRSRRCARSTGCARTRTWRSRRSRTPAARRSIGGEGLLLSLVGALLGVVVGLALGYVFVRGIATSVPSVEYAAPLGTIGAVALSGVVLGLVASILPARRAARMDVIEALSYE